MMIDLVKSRKFYDRLIQYISQGDVELEIEARDLAERFDFPLTSLESALISGGENISTAHPYMSYARILLHIGEGDLELEPAARRLTKKYNIHNTDLDLALSVGRSHLRGEKMKQKTLLVVDVQNEFCHPNGFFAKNKLTCNPEGFFGDGKLSVKSIDNAVDNIESAIAHFREEGLPIAYVRGVGDPQYLSDSRFERYKQMYEQGFLKEGTNGTNFYRIKPLGEEPVFIKGGLDAFSNTQFREYVQRTSSSLILTGFFTDVCIDAIALRAEERGIGIPTEIIADCTASLYWPQNKQLEKLKMLHGTKIHNSLLDYISNSRNNPL